MSRNQTGCSSCPPTASSSLHPLPVEKLWGVGEKTAEKLRARGIFTVGQVAHVDERALVAMLGRASGRQLHAHSHNRDLRPVVVGRRRGSVGSQRALGWRRKTRDELDASLVALVDRVTRRLRTGARVGRTVVLRLRFDDATRATRSHTLDHATARTETILDTARDLLEAAMPLIRRNGITLIGIAVGNLDDDATVQLSLPFTKGSGMSLDVALDDVRKRFGNKAVTRAVLLDKAEGLTVPLLPD